MQEWYKEKIENIYSAFSTQPEGLTEKEVIEKRKQYGKNTLKESKKISVLILFLQQFKSTFAIILIFASIIIFFLGEYVDGAIILIVILLNAVIGSIQEGKAQNTLASLKSIVKSSATVIRGGEHLNVEDIDLVPGDIIFIKDGDMVSADARLITSNNLDINEASLTGESGVVRKNSHATFTESTVRGDQFNMVFRGTNVMSGFGTAIVVATGSSTAIGAVAEGLGELHKDVPLKKNIRNLSMLILWIVGIFSFLLFVIGVLSGKTVTTMFITVVAVSVSAIPESLPVVVTLVLATGVWRMSKQNALVKRLQAVESLGQANVLAIDKTGTITKNQMTVEKLVIGSREYSVSGSGYEPIGEVMHLGQTVSPEVDKGLRYAGYVSAFTAVANIHHNKETNDWERVTGDPTEVALLVFAQKIGMEREMMEEKFPQKSEIPFSLHTKYHSAVNDIGDTNIFTVAGSAEEILKYSDKYFDNEKIVSLDDSNLNSIRRQIEKYSNDGYRLLAMAYAEGVDPNITPESIPKLTFLGFFAIRDAIRPEVYDSLKSVRAAGLRPVMITGDHSATAKSIAKTVGIWSEGDFVMTGKDLDTLPEDELMKLLERTSVFARVEPEQKLKIIEAFKKRGDIIAMTGDGVNDALSLVAADLGVSMGKIGTEVAKEASDIVLLDDNFGTIAKAVEEGRNIYSTIQKSVTYLLSTNMGELLVISIAVIFGLPLPLLATQIIWLNMVTDTFLVTALAFDPKDKSLLTEKRIKPTKYIVDKTMAIRIFLIGSVMTIATLLLFIEFIPQGVAKSTTISLAVLTAFQWFNIFNIRSNTHTLFSKDIFRNAYLWIALFVVIALQLMAIYAPFMQKVLHTTALSLKEWILILSVGLIIIFVEEIRKYFYREYSI